MVAKWCLSGLFKGNYPLIIPTDCEIQQAREMLSSANAEVVTVEQHKSPFENISNRYDKVGKTDTAGHC